MATLQNSASRLKFGSLGVSFCSRLFALVIRLRRCDVNKSRNPVPQTLPSITAAIIFTGACSRGLNASVADGGFLKGGGLCWRVAEGNLKGGRGDGVSPSHWCEVRAGPVPFPGKMLKFSSCNCAFHCFHSSNLTYANIMLRAECNEREKVPS